MELLFSPRRTPYRLLDPHSLSEFLDQGEGEEPSLANSSLDVQSAQRGADGTLEDLRDNQEGQQGDG